MLLSNQLLVLCLVFVSSLAYGREYLEKVESDVFETKGTIAEITKKAKLCIAQNLRNDSVRITDSAPSNDTFPIVSDFGSEGHTESLEGGGLFIEVDIEGGTIIANSKVDQKGFMITRNIKSTFTLLAKEDRFKIRHTNIERVQKDSGTMRNRGYNPVGKWAGTGWKKTEKALQAVSLKVAECVQADSGGDDW